MPGGRDPDALRRRAGIPGDPGADQHFLVDDRVLDRLPTYATDAGFDTSHVLEIGGGTGALTDRLLSVAKQVTVIEFDPRLVEFLRTEFDEVADRLTVIHGDATDVSLPSFTTSISNLPYGRSSEIVFRLFPLGRPLVLTFQREFAERLTAEPGTSEYGRLSVTAGHYADCEIVEIIPPEAFDPQPAVESAVVRARPREPTYDVPDEDFFMAFVRAVFTQRRKTIRNGIRNTAHISGLASPAAVVEAADEELMSRRPGDVDPSTFAHLASIAWDVGDPEEPVP